MRCSLLLLMLLIQAAGLVVEIQAAETGRFAFSFQGGERAVADELDAWPISVGSLKARLATRELYAGNDHVRLIRDLDAKVELQAPLVMLANGDVVSGLPRQLVGSDGRQGQPQRVRVLLHTPLLPVDSDGVSVRTDRVQRIIGEEGRQRRPAPQPGTVLLLDGRQLKGSSIRWQEYGLAILTDNGLVQAAFTELADVVFPQVDSLSRGVGRQFERRQSRRPRHHAAGDDGRQRADRLASFAGGGTKPPKAEFGG